MKKVFEKDFYGKKIVVESGELAKQANGAVLVRFNDTAILTAAVMSKNASTADCSTAERIQPGCAGIALGNAEIAQCPS